MQHISAVHRVAAVPEAKLQTQHRGWRARGYQVSIVSSLVMALVIGGFFIAMAGWGPTQGREDIATFGVIWIMLTYIWVQMGSLILVGAGSKNQMWLDALTSIVPLFLIVYVLLQHYSGYVLLSPFQAKTAWVIAYTMLLDVVIDLGVSVLLSRQVVDVGGSGVG